MRSREPDFNGSWDIDDAIANEVTPLVGSDSFGDKLRFEVFWTFKLFILLHQTRNLILLTDANDRPS